MATEIKGRILVDTAAATKSTKELKDEILATKKALDAAKIGSEEYKAAQKQLQQQQEQLKKSTEEAKASHEKSGEAFGVLKEKVTALLPGLQGAQTGVKGLGAELKVLLLNPIVGFLALIVASLALVYKAFTNTFEGGEKMQQVFAGIKAAGQSLIDNLEKIGRVIKNVFTFHWGDAVDGIKDVAKAAGEAYDAMAALEQKGQAIHKDQLANDLDQAERQKKLAILREQAADDADPKKRIQALKELQQAARDNSIEDIRLAKQFTENEIAKLTLQKEGAKKNQDEINALKIKQINVETENANELRRIDKQLTAAQKQEISEREAAQKVQDENNKKRIEEAKRNMAELEKLQDDTFKHSLNKQDLAILLLEQKYAKELALLKKNHADTLLLENNFRKDMAAVLASSLQKETVEVTKAVGIKIVADNTVRDSALKANWDIDAAEAISADIKKQTAQIKIDAAMEEADAFGQAANIVAGIVGKQTVAGKVLATASSLIHTWQGIAAGVRLGFPQMIPAVLAASVTGFKAVKAINSVQIPGISAGSSSVTAPTIVAPPLAPQQSSTRLDQSSINGIGNAALGGVNRSFVLDSDIKSNDERAARINRAARLG